MILNPKITNRPDFIDLERLFDTLFVQTKILTVWEDNEAEEEDDFLNI